MPDFSPLLPKAGDPIRAELLVAILEELKALRRVRGGPGITARRGPGGDLQLAVTGARGSLAKATSDFAARSGTTPGTGSIDLYYVDPSGPTITARDVSIPTAYNVSSSTMTSGHSIDSGMYCWADPDAAGNWLVTPLECS